MGKKKKKILQTSPPSASPPPPPPPSKIAPKRGKSGREIDEIFSRGNALKKRKSEDEEEEKPQEEEAKHSGKKVKKKQKTFLSEGGSSEDLQAGKPAPSKPRRKTKDGFTIYSEEELGWNRKTAGGTALCPFDCDCCF